MTARVSAVRGAVRRAHHALLTLRSTRHTVMRDVFDRPAPAPHAFAAFGEGSWIVPPCEVTGAADIEIGENVVVLEHSSVRVFGTDPSARPRLRLGDRVRLGRFVTIVCEAGIELGDDVAGSDCITITDTWRDAAFQDDGPGGLPLPRAEPIRVGSGAYLGYGCTIGPGVHVGAGGFVGEGAVVTEDVAPFTVVYGSPAVVVRRYDDSTASWKGPRWP